jgi:putative intracellular protease/amidase
MDQMFAEDKQSQDFLKDETVKQKFANAIKLSDVNVSKYDAIFYVGGHGPVIDLASDPVNAKLASEVCTCHMGMQWFGCADSLDQFYQAGKITSAVCHGPA